MISIEKIVIFNNPKLKNTKPYLLTIEEIKLFDEEYYEKGFSGIILLNDKSWYAFDYIDKGWEFIQLDDNEKRNDSFINLGSLVHSFDKFLVRKNSFDK